MSASPKAVEAVVLAAVKASFDLWLHARASCRLLSCVPPGRPVLLPLASGVSAEDLSGASAALRRALAGSVGRMADGRARRILKRAGEAGTATSLLIDAERRLIWNGRGRNPDPDLWAGCSELGRQMAEALGGPAFAGRVSDASLRKAGNDRFGPIPEPEALESIGDADAGFDRLAEFFGLSSLERIEVFMGAP